MILAVLTLPFPFLLTFIVGFMVGRVSPCERAYRRGRKDQAAKMERWNRSQGR